MKENIYRFSYNEGECGGVVISYCWAQARRQVERYLRGLQDGGEYDGALLVVWPWEQDQYFSADNPGVINCYGC